MSIYSKDLHKVTDNLAETSHWQSLITKRKYQGKLAMKKKISFVVFN